jgi:6,7-dimethyl-8-ribityllumazine synthase
LSSFDEDNPRVPYGVTPETDPDEEPLPLIRVHTPRQEPEPEPEPDPEPQGAVEQEPEPDPGPEPVSEIASENAMAAVVEERDPAPAQVEREAEAAVEPAAAPPEHAAGGLSLPSGVVAYEGYPEGAERTVGIVVSRFNGEITNRLLDGAMQALEAAGVARDRIDLMAVPGAFELPIGAMALAKTRRYSCVLALGCVIRGDTPHFDFICSEAASGLQLAGLETGVPVSFGVLTCDDEEQARARAGGEHGNKGAEAARTALEMADVFARLRASA